VGGYLTYTVRYTNTGGGILSTLLFTDALDSRVNFMSASANCTISGAQGAEVVKCTGTPLSPGQAGWFTITVQSIRASNNDLLINLASYLYDNQKSAGLPVRGTTARVEVPVSSVGAAADFVGNLLSGSVPLVVTFKNLSSGSGITGYQWDFGDGTTSTSGSSTVIHSYKPGVYTVSLTITTASGSNTRTRRNYVSAGGWSVYVPFISR
jgi:uncharacterized repeat protein (TIGR01451 family)